MNDKNPTSNPDMVNNPSHYQGNGGLECIDAMLAAFGEEQVKHFCLCNAFKYIWRCQNKGTYRQDVKKAIWYLAELVTLDDNNK